MAQSIPFQSRWQGQQEAALEAFDVQNMPRRTQGNNRYRVRLVVRELFPDEEDPIVQLSSKDLIVGKVNKVIETMTSSQFHQTMASQTQTQEDDNYVKAIDGNFTTRLRFWIDKSPGVSTYQIQLCAIFEAGSTINLNDLEKEPVKLKEMVTKYESVVKSIGREGILLPSEVNNLKTLKHASKKKKKNDITELDGWPTGRSLWDRYITCRKEIRKSCNLFVNRRRIRIRLSSLDCVSLLWCEISSVPGAWFFWCSFHKLPWLISLSLSCVFDFFAINCVDSDTIDTIDTITKFFRNKLFNLLWQIDWFQGISNYQRLYIIVKH